MPAPTLWERLLSRASARALPPALILVHPDPDGGLEEARELARRHMCTGLREEDCPCTDCRMLRADSHPDVRIILPEGKTMFKVDQIRGLREEAQKPPFMGAGKFFIIFPARLLNPSSSNALLKALEEPFPSTHFILVTVQPFLLLPTLRSRCSIIPLPRSAQDPEPEEDLLGAWDRLRREGSRMARMQFLKLLSLEDNPRIPRTLMRLWRADPDPFLSSLAKAYLKILTTTPSTFNRLQALETLADKADAGSLLSTAWD